MEVKEKDPEIVIHDLTLVSPDRTRKDIQDVKSGVVSAEQIHFPNRVKLYDMYHDIRSMDGYLRGIISKRIDSVLNKTLQFTNSKGQIDQDITDLMTSEAGRDLITLIMESKMWGISGVEFIIGEKFGFKEIPRKHIKPEKGLVTKSQYSTTEADAYKYKEMPFVWVIGKENDLGLLLGCSMYAVYKRGTFGDWAQYVEIFGQPVRIIYYDAYDTKTKGELKQILTESGASLAMMIPKQAEFEMMDGKTSNGDGKLQQSFKDACNSEMAICILGNTETTSSSSSSGYAQSKEHGEQQDILTASDLIFVQNMLNSARFLGILKSYGYAVDGGKFGFELELNLANLKLRMEIDEFVSAKVPVADDYWYNTYGIPKPDNYDELKKKQEEKDAALLTVLQQKPNPEKPGKKPTKKTDLIDLSSSKLKDVVFKSLADFFDRARQ